MFPGMRTSLHPAQISACGKAAFNQAGHKRGNMPVPVPDLYLVLFLARFEINSLRNTPASQGSR